MPNSFAETSNGLVLIANGIDPVLRWDSLTSQADTAGVIPPSAPVVMNGSGLGGIIGTYYAYVRFYDGLGNYSNLSPISLAFTAQSTTGAITGATNATPIVITSASHGLTTGAIIDILNVEGNGGANGTWTITVVDGDNFSLNGSAGTADYTTNGTWQAGVASITYSGVAIPAESKVVGRQILRNTAGQALVFYVDVDTGPDLTSTTFTSTNIDVILGGGQAQAIFDQNNRPLANLNTVPPSHKAVICAHLDRMFMAVEITYSEGCIAVTFGSLTVQGYGTEWPVTFAGRVIYVAGATQSYFIASVDALNQVITLDVPYQGVSNPYATYAVQPAPTENRLIYYSESGLPESWPAFDALELQEDGDQLTGLMAKGSFIYFLERNHIYRFTYQSDPALDGYVFLSAVRGCVNNRCWVQLDDTAYMLDEAGVHGFDGGTSEPLSLQIQDLFEAEPETSLDFRINWASQSFFHAVHYPGQQTIRWFVALSGNFVPRHALTYDYRQKRWWIEEFPFNVGSSCLGRINNEPRVFLGASAGRCFAYGVGSLDGPSPLAGAVGGSGTGSTPTSLSDTTAAFAASGLVGSPICITGGRGKGQRRIITSVSGSRLEVNQPWLIQPDITSTYTLGGIQWTYRTGWFRFAEGDEEMVRRLEITFYPVSNPNTFDARFYLDRSKTPLLWDMDYSSLDGNGFATLSGQPDLTGDLTKSIGFLQKRLDGRRELYIDGERYVQLEMRGVSGVDNITFHQIKLDGVTTPSGE